MSEYARTPELDIDKHLLEISDDPTGSELVDYLNEKRTELCLEFLEAARQNGWPNAERVEMRVTRLGGPTWKAPLQHERQESGLIRAIRTKQVDSWRGYFIGELQIDNVARRSRVMLCEDGTLRCLRDPRIFTASYGDGYGTLPVATAGRKRVSQIIDRKSGLPLATQPVEPFIKMLRGYLE